MTDYPDFLRAQAATQTRSIASYHPGGEQLWLKKAGARNSMGRYRLMGTLARTLRLPLLTPVPNLGGEQAIPPRCGGCASWHRSVCRFPPCWRCNPMPC